MSEKTINNNRSLGKRLTRAALARLENPASAVVSNYRIRRNDKRDLQLGNRKKIGLIDTEPKAIVHTPEGLTPRQKALREAVIQRFTAKKINRYITEQIKHINYKQHLADGIRFLFDEHGRPPANAPLEDIIAVREKIESDIKMLEAICFAMRNHLSKVKEAEDMAFELIGGQNKK
jgi:hypothetical protein